MIGNVLISKSDGSFRLEEKEFEEPKISSYETQKIIDQKKQRLTELSRDFEQDRLGFVIPNLEERKQEVKTLLNEVRVLMGKSKREEKTPLEEIADNNL